MSEETKEIIYEDLQGNLRFHQGWAVRHHSRWSRFALCLQFALPVLSGVLTVIAADRSGLSGPAGQAAVFWLGAVLTVLTGLNSAIQPGKKVVFYAQYANRFKALQTELNIELQEVADTYEKGTKEFHLKRTELLKRKNREITNMVDAYNSGQSLSADAKALAASPAEQR